LSLLTGLLFGALPALRASRFGLKAALAAGGRGAGGGRRSRGAAGALVAAEIALAVVLVIGAGLLVKSFRNVLRVDPGFRAEEVVSALVAPPDFRYADDAARRDFFVRLQERVEGLPGAELAATTSQLPFAGGAYGSGYSVQVRPD